MLVTFVIPLLGVSCGQETEERLTTGSRAYAIPSEHIGTVTREPHTFVRIKHPERPFELVYDSRSQGVPDARGAPTIFSINDGSSQGIDYHRSEVGIITCRRAASPGGGCGVKLKHGESEWSVLFGRSLLGKADQIAVDAVALLDHYEI